MKSGQSRDKPLTRERVIELLDRINRELAERGKTAELYVVGGTAMTLEYTADRRTDDIDCQVQGDVFEVTEAAETIRSEEKDLRDDWLNTYAADLGFLPETPDREPRKSYAGSHLTVWTASAERLLAMKLNAGRAQDSPDIRTLLRETGVMSAKEAARVLNDAYPGKDMPHESGRTIAEWLAEQQRTRQDAASATPTRPRITTPRRAGEKEGRTR